MFSFSRKGDTHHNKEFKGEFKRYFFQFFEGKRNPDYDTHDSKDPNIPPALYWSEKKKVEGIYSVNDLNIKSIEYDFTNTILIKIYSNTPGVINGLNNKVIDSLNNYLNMRLDRACIVEVLKSKCIFTDED